MRSSGVANDANQHGLTLRRVLGMTDDEARVFIEAVRWGHNGGLPMCPECGHDKAYFIATGM